MSKFKKEPLVMETAKELVKEKISDYTGNLNKSVKDIIGATEAYIMTDSNEERKNIIASKTKEITEKLSATFENLTLTENVDHPNHYGGDTIYEVIKVLEAWNLDFHLGNVVKYVSRAGKKDKTRELEDLEKALWYLQRRIKILKEENRNID